MTQPTGRPRGRPRKNPPPHDDLIGAPTVASKPKKTAPPKVDPARYEGEGEPLTPTLDIAEVYGGVSATWLAQVFGADKNTIKKKLARADDAIVGRGRNNTPLYSIPHAAAYLVKPKVDLVSYVKGLRPNDLPPILNDAYWSAMTKRQKWEENAGDLWRTEDVLAVFGDVAFMIKTTAQLWVEDIDRHHGLTPEMRITLTQLVDNLLEQVYEKMIEMPSKRRTRSSIADDAVMPDDGSRPPEGVDVV